LFARDREKEVRERVLFLFSLIEIALLLYFGIYNLSLSKEHLGAIEIAASIILAVNLIYLSARRKHRLSTTIFLTISLFVLLILLLTGGVYETGIFWVFLFPVVTFLLEKPKRAILWNLLLVGLFIAVIILDSLKKPFIQLPYSTITLKQALLVYVSLVAFLYFYSQLFGEYVEDMVDFAVKDPLTKLYNRAFAFSYLNQELEKLKRREIKSLCVIYLDLDNFKTINDLLGHSVGDKVLKKVSELLRGNFRKGDVIARIGGDEFIVVITNCYTPKIVERIENLKREIEERFSKFNLSLSYGLAEAPKDGTTVPMLIKVADERMYQNKKERKMERKSAAEKGKEEKSSS